MKLVSIPKEKYEEYRENLIFDCYKWDPQFLDNNTVAKYVLVLTKEEHQQLEQITEALDKETRNAEDYLNEHLELTKPLALPRNLKKEVASMTNYEADKHIRLMRYDFHPTTDGGWAVSEVNSDVPGGWAESSLIPKVAKMTIGEEKYHHKCLSDYLIKSIKEKVVEKGRIMLVHCTSFSDDRQVMQFLGDELEKLGYEILYGAADHVNFKDKITYSILDGNEGKLDAIIRFSPLEWVVEMKPKRWQGYFNTTTVSCNHPIAIFAQTKRFPLVWDLLEANGISMENWRRYLPETLDVKKAKGREGFIYKPANGRVGENISIKEACKDDEYKKILQEVFFRPKDYIAQKRFDSRAILADDGNKLHACIGSYTVDGKHAGYYARVSALPRIDSNAADIPVLIEGEEA